MPLLSKVSRPLFRSFLLGTLAAAAGFWAATPAKAILPVLTFPAQPVPPPPVVCTDPNIVCGGFDTLSGLQTSYGYGIDFNGTFQFDRLGLIAPDDFCPSPPFAPNTPNPQAWTSGDYVVSLWEYNYSLNNPTQIEAADFSVIQSFNFQIAQKNTYAVQDGFYWSTPLTIGPLTGSPGNPDHGFLIGAVGTFSSDEVLDGFLGYYTSTVASPQSMFNYGVLYDLNGASDNNDPLWAGTQAPYNIIQDINGDDINGYYNVNLSYVPGPLPIMGAAAAFSWSRRLRQRLKTLS